MKKLKKKTTQSQNRRWFFGVLCVFTLAVVLWGVFSPRHKPYVPQHVRVRVEQPHQDIGLAGTGDERAQPDNQPQPIVPPVRPPGAAPEIAIVIDDMGLNLKGSRMAIHLPAAVTLSFLPYALRLREQTKEARDHGHELLLHMPMEPVGRDDPGPGALLVGLSEDDVRHRLQTALASFVGFDGVNNHMGSKFTADADGMNVVISELKERNLFFLDSRTSARTVGEKLAREQGLPTLSRDVFLDDTIDQAAILHQLEQTERTARHKGYAVAIGHPHAVTMEILAQWLPEAEARGIKLVPVKALFSKPSEPE